MWRFHVLFVIWVNPLLFLGVRHGVLGSHMILSNSSEILLHCSVSNDLLSTDHFLLHSVHFIFVNFLFFHELLLPNLHLSLEVNLVGLALGESFEVVWLNSVGSQHRNLSRWVFSHEICIISELNLNFLSIFPILVHLNISVLLLLGQDLVYSKRLLSS